MTTEAPSLLAPVSIPTLRVAEVVGAMGGQDIPHGWEAVRADWQCYVSHHRARGLLSKAALLWREKAFWALATYRFGRWAALQPRSLVRRPARFFYAVLYQLILRITKVQLSPTASIASDVWFASHHTIIVAPGSVLGRGVRMYGDNTLGVAGREGARGVPVLGEGVELHPGAVVIGPVHIAAGARIGPNSVVTKSISEPGAWLGVPARRASCDLAPASREPAPSESSLGTLEPFWTSWREDLEQLFAYYDRPSRLMKLRICLTVDSVWALGVYRWGRSLLTRRAARPWWLAYRLAEAMVGHLTGIQLHPTSAIAPGFYIGHFGSIVVGPNVRIGRHSAIGQMCVIAASGPEGRNGAPVLGERVYVGVGAKIMGGVHIGDGAAVGANAVVLEDVAANAVVVGNPASTINYRGSADFIVLGRTKGAPPPTPSAEASAAPEA